MLQCYSVRGWYMKYDKLDILMLHLLFKKGKQNRKEIIYQFTSAQINPLSKSVWIVPAAWGAFIWRLICQHFTWKEIEHCHVAPIKWIWWWQYQRQETLVNQKFGMVNHEVNNFEIKQWTWSFVANCEKGYIKHYIIDTRINTIIFTIFKGLSNRFYTSSGPAVKKYMRLIAENPVLMIFGSALHPSLSMSTWLFMNHLWPLK